MRFSTTLSQMGNHTGIEVPPEAVVALEAGKHLLPFSAERRRESGIAGGDPIDFELTAAPIAAGAWEKLAPSAKKAHVTAILGAKAAETRASRVAKIVSGLGS